MFVLLHKQNVNTMESTKELMVGSLKRTTQTINGLVYEEIIFENTGIDVYFTITVSLGGSTTLNYIHKSFEDADEYITERLNEGFISLLI